MQTRHQNNVKLLRQVRGKQQGARRDRAEADAVTAELARDPARPAYRSLGRCFVREPADTLRADMAAQHERATRDADKYDKQSEVRRRWVA